MKKEEQSKSLDYINLAYGVGAAIVIVAAMFKFLGWDYSNEFFLIGLSTEALVFLISAFEYKQVTSTYKWENVFPELTDDTAPSKLSINQFGEMNANSAEALTKSIESFDGTLKRLNAATEALTSSAENIKNQVGITEKTSIEYATGLESFKNSINNSTFTKTMSEFDATLKQLAASIENLSQSAQLIQTQITKSEKSTVDYASEMESLKVNLNKVNNFYKEMLQVMGQKN